MTNPTTSVRTTARAATVALQPVFWRLIFGLLICHLATDRSFGQTDDEPQFDEIVDLAADQPDLTDLLDIQGDATAHEAGMWSPAARWPLVAIHAALLPNGDVLTYGTNEYAEGGSGFVYDRWTPSEGLAPASHFTMDVQTSNNLFCSAQTLLPGSGGLMLVTGGSVEVNGRRNYGVRAVNVYDPIDDTFFKPFHRMQYARWYPTVTVLADGRVLVQGGRNEKRRPTLTPEIFDPQNGSWKKMTGATSETVYGDIGWNYPRSFLCPNGKVLVMPVNQRDIYFLSTRGRGQFTRVRELPVTTTAGNELAVMYEDSKILSIRGTDARKLTLEPNHVRSENIADISSHRFWADATLLPNGEVLITGGSAVRQSLANAVNQVEIWNPDTETFRVGAVGNKARLYHSTSLLLPNGTVLVAGGGPPGPTANLNAEIYYPPYLFDSSGNLRQRPRLLGDVAAGGSLITIRARGDEGTELLELQIEGEAVATFGLTTSDATYSYLTDRPVTGRQVRVAFVNDNWQPDLGIDANATVDRIEIDGITYESEDPRVFSVGTPADPGFRETDFLVRNGYFEYFDRTLEQVDLGTIGYGGHVECFFDSPEPIESVRLIRFGSVTHSFDMGQRGLTLDFTVKNGVLSTQLPTARKRLPPGHYMLFVCDASGTPSTAAVLEVL